MFYSKSAGGFYDTAIHGDNIPTDAVEITAGQHAELLAAQSAGKVIQADKDGKPVAVDPPKPSAAEMWVDYQRQAQTALDRTDGVAIRCWKAGVPYPAEWLAYTNSLRAIIRASSGDLSQPLPTQPAYPEGT